MITQPLRSSDRSSLNWMRTNALDAAHRFAQKQSTDVFHERSRRQRDLGLDDAGAIFHPFELYSFPSCWRATPNIATDWLKFRIHGGRYFGVIVPGTDGIDKDPGGAGYIGSGPDSQIITEAGATEYTLTSGQTTWFWLDATDPANPVIKKSATPASNGWPSFPTPDATHIPIGFVDATTNAADRSAIVRQILRHDVSAGGSGGGGGAGAGFYVIGDAYPPGFTVQVINQMLVQTQSGNVTVQPGSYVCASAVSLGSPPIANAVPQYPYPTSGIIYWLYLAPVPIAFQVCSGGNKTIYVAATSPF